jgi:hypothetical protein
MMGGETFILLKAALLGAKGAKQAERRLNVLPTILSIVGRRSVREGRKNTCMGCISGDFRWIWLIPQDSQILLPRSQI